jgi:peptide-methionine (S)-S-oxide reductase
MPGDAVPHMCFTSETFILFAVWVRDKTKSVYFLNFMILLPDNNTLKGERKKNVTEGISAPTGVESPESSLPARQLAILAGGCFWCTEAVFARVRGVIRVEPGYIGGKLSDSANYEAVCNGDTGHAEAVRIEFDPAVLAYADILRVFFATHDPTQLNRQGNDVGTQYRSAVFWCDEAQRAQAQAMLRELDASGAFQAPVVTELVPASAFHVAEAYHHDYFSRNPGQGYCAYVIAPKLARFRQRFAALLRHDG